MSIEQQVGAGIKLLRALTWKRLGQLAVLLVLAMVGTTFWLARDSIVQMVKPAKFSTERPPLVVSTEAERAIESTLRQAPMFVAIGVVSVDMPRNTRQLIFFRSLDPVVTRIQKDYADTHPSPVISLFNTDPENNARLIRLINGEMVCVPLEASRSAPFLAGTGIKHVCAVGTPPYYSAFRGSVLAYLGVAPTADDLVQVRIVLRGLSNQLDNPSSDGKSRPSS